MDASKSWTILEEQGWARVELRGRIDSFNFNVFQSDVEAALNPLNKSVAFDVSKVQFISLRGLQYMDEVSQRLRDQGCRAALVGPSEKLKRQIDIYANLDHWEIFRTLTDLKENRPDARAFRDPSDHPFASL